jgi:hypothetical protein
MLRRHFGGFRNAHIPIHHQPNRNAHLSVIKASDHPPLHSRASVIHPTGINRSVTAQLLTRAIQFKEEASELSEVSRELLS